MSHAAFTNDTGLELTGGGGGRPCPLCEAFAGTPVPARPRAAPVLFFSSSPSPPPPHVKNCDAFGSVDQQKVLAGGGDKSLPLPFPACGRLLPQRQHSFGKKWAAGQSHLKPFSKRWPRPPHGCCPIIKRPADGLKTAEGSLPWARDPSVCVCVLRPRWSFVLHCMRFCARRQHFATQPM